MCGLRPARDRSSRRVAKPERTHPGRLPPRAPAGAADAAPRRACAALRRRRWRAARRGRRARMPALLRSAPSEAAVEVFAFTPASDANLTRHARRWMQVETFLADVAD